MYPSSGNALNYIHFTVSVPLTIPTPIIESTKVWVGDMGLSKNANLWTTDAIDIWAEKPLLGTNSVIRLPIVPVILPPASNIPKTHQ